MFSGRGRLSWGMRAASRIVSETSWNRVTQPLSRDARHRQRGVGCAAALELAAVQGDEKLGIEAAVLVSQAVVRDRRHVVAEEFLGEAGRFQGGPYIPAQGRIG